jgi:hypothetical protein
VNQLRIIGVVAGPLLRFDGRDPATDAPVPTTVHSGYVGLERDTQFRGIVHAGAMEDCSFFVPDSAPYTAPPAMLGIETSLRTIRTMGNPNLVFFGAHDAQVAVVPDPRGTGQQWLQISFRTPAASLERVEINYRVTVQG